MTKISQLPVEPSPSTTDVVPMVDVETNTTKKSTLSSLISLFFNNIPSGSIDSDSIEDGAITPNKLLLGASSNRVNTTQTTTTTSYTNLGTTGPSVTITVPASGRVLLSFGARVSNTSSGGWGLVSYDASGANTISASDTYSAGFRVATANDECTVERTEVLTGLTPGSTTFTLKYRAVAGTAQFLNRYLSVVPL